MFKIFSQIVECLKETWKYCSKKQITHKILKQSSIIYNIILIPFTEIQQIPCTARQQMNYPQISYKSTTRNRVQRYQPYDYALFRGMVLKTSWYHDGGGGGGVCKGCKESFLKISELPFQNVGKNNENTLSITHKNYYWTFVENLWASILNGILFIILYTRYVHKTFEESKNTYIKYSYYIHIIKIYNKIKNRIPW